MICELRLATPSEAVTSVLSGSCSLGMRKRYMLSSKLPYSFPCVLDIGYKLGRSIFDNSPIRFDRLSCPASLLTGKCLIKVGPSKPGVYLSTCLQYQRYLSTCASIFVLLIYFFELVLHVLKNLQDLWVEMVGHCSSITIRDYLIGFSMVKGRLIRPSAS